MNDKNQSSPPQKPRGKRRVLIGLAIVVAVIALLPTIVAMTPLRNWIVNAAIADANLQATTGSVSLGWFSPLAVHELAVRGRGGHERDPVTIEVESIQADMSWIEMLRALPDDIGTIHLERPRLELHLPDKWPEGGAEPKRVPTATITVSDASVRVFGAKDATEPVVNLEQLALELQRTNGPSGGKLTIEPITIFDRKQLTPELCGSGLQLIAPVLADATKVSGEISFSLSKFDVPLTWNEATRDSIRIEGNLNLHSVDVGLQDSPILAAVKLGATILRIDMPESMRISEESDIHFAVRDGRIHHEGFAIGLPDVSEELVIRTSGSVGLDESLDLLVEIPIPRRLSTAAVDDTTPVVPRKPIVLRIRGTLDEPKIELPENDHWATDLVGQLLKKREPGEEGPIAGALDDILSGLLERRVERTDANEPGETPISDLLRKRREERRNRRGE